MTIPDLAPAPGEVVERALGRFQIGLRPKAREYIDIAMQSAAHIQRGTKMSLGDPDHWHQIGYMLCDGMLVNQSVEDTSLLTEVLEALGYLYVQRAKNAKSDWIKTSTCLYLRVYEHASHATEVFESMLDFVTSMKDAFELARAAER